MKNYILFFAIISIQYLFAQTPEQQINDRMTYVFAQLNRSNVPTGILSNYGVQSYYNHIY